MLKVVKVSKEFVSGDGHVSAVDNVSFEVPDGQFVSIIGKSGSGKTTLLSLLGTLERPTKGTIEVGGRDVASLNDHSLVAYRRKKIGFVFQSYNLLPNLNLTGYYVASRFCRRSPARAQTRAQPIF